MKSRYKLSFRIISLILIWFHIFSFGGISNALAEVLSSANYKLTSGTLNEGGKDRGIGYTKLLLHLDGANGSTEFKDESGKSVLANGDAKIDTSQSKFGGASGYFDGTGDYITLADSDDWSFGSGDFTIDFWARFNSFTNYYSFFHQDGGGQFELRLKCDEKQIQFLAYNGAGGTLASYGAILKLSTNTWYHFALARNGANMRFFQDGVSISLAESYAISTKTLSDCTSTLKIGSNAGTDYFMDGRIDEFRISKGIARWTSNFTPPTKAYDSNSDIVRSSPFPLDVLGEPCIGKTESASYILSSGFIPAAQSNPPVLTQSIPYQKWAMNSAKTNALDLDDYFSSLDGYTLSYTASGNSKVNVSIDSTTHIVSFSQPQGWFGVEEIYFEAADSEYNTTLSNKVSLQVENPAAPDNPVIISAQLNPVNIKEGDLVKLTVQATDPDLEELSFSYSDFFVEQRKWKDGDYWYSESAWQTNTKARGHYNIKVTVTDPTGLKDSEDVLVNVGNFNHAPVLDPIADITVNEGELAVIIPHATDADNDPINYYFEYPFDTTGKWLTDYDAAGTHIITVTASDGIDTVSQSAKVIVNNTNRLPTLNLTLSKYTLEPSEPFAINLTAVDPDNDAMTFSIQKDATEISSGAISGKYSLVTSIPSEGYYKIIAKVKDAGGLEAVASKDVQVTVRKASIPVMGDFNGDALTDLGLHDSDTGNWEVCLSKEGKFESAAKWLSNFGASKDWAPIGGDFNGDSKTDIGIYNYTTGELKIAASSGSSFTDSGLWLTVSFASYAWQPFTGNFNGDKYTDIAFYNRDTQEVRVFLCTGTGFSAYTTWLENCGTEYTALGGDFNGDSLTDLCLFKKSSGEFKVYFSNTKAFVDGASWISSYATNKDPQVSDFNNDGLTDIGYWDKDSHKWYYAISTGEKFIDKGLWLDNFGRSGDDSATTGDFDGNGITDAATFDSEGLGITRWNTYLSGKKPADLLTGIDNSIGGKTKVTYTYAAKADNDGLPFPVYVASEVSAIDTLPAGQPQEAYTQNFNYSGGYFDSAEREFRGFAKVKVTDPITKNYSETYFYQGKPGQDGALKGQVDKIISYDGNSRQISQIINTYEVRKSGPTDGVLGFPYVKESITTIWEENGTNISTKQSFSFDNIGNLTEQRDEGDVAKAGDEKSSATIYAQGYETGFNRPLEASLKDKDGNVVTKKNNEYDAKGNLKKEIVIIHNPVTLKDDTASSQYTYDSFGNALTSANALGRTVTTEYETTFYAYPKKVTNSLGQSVQYVYDPNLGVVTSVTDANGKTSTTEYDSLGRPLNVYNARNELTTNYQYPDFNTKITAQQNLKKSEYIDGLGRKYKAVSSGEDGAVAKDVVAEVFYNNRGLTDKESIAHYVDEDPANIAYVKYEYDIRGRIKKTISDFPGTLKDAESSIVYKEPLYTEATDPKGHKKGVRKDINGNNIEIIEFTSDGVFHTYYEYDIQNNLTKLTDNQGNITQLFYDSANRKAKMIDPDMGAWLYEYDVLGNLTKQTDAKGQALKFEYDALNRLTRKVSLRGAAGGGDEAISQYSYDDAAKSNCIGRLSKVTDQSGSTEFFYDDLGREIKSTKSLRAAAGGEAIYTVQREYDIFDRLTKLTYPDGKSVIYAYDMNSGLLESLRSAEGGEAIYVKDITYNAKGQIKAIQYGNNTQTDYTYGQDLRLSKILTQGPAGNLQNLNYDFDKNGNLTTLNDNLHSNIRTYGYDGLDRLKEALNTPSPSGGYTNFYYQYDSIGNMTYKSDVGVMTYGLNAGPHALTGAGGYTYKYDANGNMTQGKNKVMEYDAENRLTKVDELGTVSTFVYDGDGGRVRKSSLRGAGVSGSGDEAISTAYIGSLYEIDSDGKTTKHIFAGANRVATVSLRGAAGGGDEAISYYHQDHLGSSNVISDKDGKLAQYCEYTPYGTIAQNTVIASPEGAKQSRISHYFTGKELDRTGLYFYGARYYDPEIGRFISADTIVQSPYDPQSLNRYSYCRNNPINYIDPTGHKWSWGNFWKSFAGVFVGVVATMLLGPGGALAWYGWTMASIVGGAIGGAITGGLQGGWKGALMGAAIGGAMGGLGAWGVANYGWGFTAGMFAAGAGMAGATNSWDSFAGGVAGGLSGWAAGSGINNAFQPKEAEGYNLNRPTNGNANNKPDGEAQNALTTDKKPNINDPIAGNKNVGTGMDKAWTDSQAYTSSRHEEGGWIIKNNDGDLGVTRWPSGQTRSIQPTPKPDNAVGHFHTHPNYGTGGNGMKGPSPDADIPFTKTYGVPGYIVDKESVIRVDPKTGEWGEVAQR